MKILFLMLIFVSISTATVNLSNTPIWQSAAPTGYATGGAWADINNDAPNHYLDLVVSTGNDIAVNRNQVYFNQGGMLATTPGWQSNDIAYHGHCDVADFNRDGFLDVASAGFGPAGGGSPGVDRVYRNNGSGLPTTANWNSADSDYTFGLAWGDYDCDGDLDLATASCWDYTPPIQYRFKVYQNNGGNLSVTPAWQSAQTYFGDDVEFADINRDGFLDLVCGCSGTDQHELVFINTGSGLPPNPTWTSADSGRTIQIAVGDFDADGWLDLAAADNAQTGGISKIKVYRNINGVLETTPSWQSNLDLDRDNYSCVAWADCDLDGYPELAAGGWWEPAVVFENNHGNLNPTPVWSWDTTPPGALVCESVLWGDMDGGGRINVADESHTANGTAKCFYANHRPLERITSVKINGFVRPQSEYCWHPLGGWVSFANAPANGASVQISYTYSYAPDLAVTNWQDNNHNYVFANLGNVGIDLVYFEATAARSGGVCIGWASGDESSVSGYRLYRRQANQAGTKWVLLNQKPIVGTSPYQYQDAGANQPIIWEYALEAICGDGLTQRFGPVSVDLNNQVMLISLSTPAPNPAHIITSLHYSCAEQGGRLEIHDLAGRLVRRWDLAPTAGEASLEWDLRDTAGQRVASGVYQVILSSGGMRRSHRLVVSR